MKHICFILMMLIALTASAAGIQKLIDGLTPKPSAPQPAPPKPLSTPVLAPKPVPQPVTTPKPAAPAPQKSITNSNNPTTDTNRPCSPTDTTCKK